MLLKVLFWLFVAVDVAALGLFFVLGLAAAGPSKTNPLAVLFTMLVVPGAILAGCIALHLHSQSALLRTIALVVVGAPIGILAIGQLASLYELSTWTPGSILGETPLTRALRELPDDPSRLDEVQRLLQNGADPKKTGEDLPIVLAIRAARTSGDAALRLLLDAGADPNARTDFGDPAWFSAAAATMDVAVMRLLLDRGADVKAVAQDGRSAVWSAVNTQNWPVALLLLERGASVGGISPMGMPLLATLEAEARGNPVSDGLRQVIAAVRARQ